VIERFVRLNPRVRIRLRTDNSAGITDRVASTEADIGIGSPLGDTARLQCTSLLVAPLGLLGDPKRFRLRGSIDADVLATLPLLKEAEDTSIMQVLRAHGSLLVPAMSDGVEVSCLASQLALAQAGVGVAVVSALGASHPQAQGLRFVPLAPRVSREVFAIQRTDRRPNPSAEALLHAIKHGMGAIRLHKSVRKWRPSA
jgi:LysR family carnitine catabolism transcriptional activator